MLISCCTMLTLGELSDGYAYRNSLNYFCNISVGLKWFQNKKLKDGIKCK